MQECDRLDSVRSNVKCVPCLPFMWPFIWAQGSVFGSCSEWDRPQSEGSGYAHLGIKSPPARSTVSCWPCDE
eukprot:4894478-Prymnesium_polylepis.1